jgi:MFS family permease
MASATRFPSPLAVASAGALSLAVAIGIGRFAFTPMLPLMVRCGVIDVAQGGWLAAANYLGYFAGAWLAPRLRWSAYRLALVALLTIAVSTAAMALHAPPLWLAWRFLAGVASACAFVGTSVWCLAALASSGHGRFGSAVYAGVGAGIAVTGLWCLAGANAGASAHALWLELGALSLAAAAGLAAVLPHLPAIAAAAPAATTAVVPSGTRGLVLAYGAMGFGYILPATFLPLLARSVIDDPRVFGLAWPVFGATAAASMAVAGWLLRRASRLRVWSASQFAMGVGVLLPSLWRSGWAIALSALLVGGTFMVITLAGVQEIRACAPLDGTRLVARMTAAFALGQIAGPLLSTILAHWPGSREQALDIALQVGALALLASAAWLWRRAGSHTSSKELSHVR